MLTVNMVTRHSSHVLFFCVWLFMMGGLIATDTEHFPDVLLAGRSRNEYSIWRMDVETKSMLYSVPMDSPNQVPHGVDYDPVEQTIYWVERQRIRALPLNQTRVITVKDITGLSVGRLAVDPLSRLIFYTGKSKNVIVMMSMTTFAQRTIITTGHFSYISTPLALDTVNRVLFWANDVPCKIERASYEGTDRAVIVSGDYMTIIGLAVDIPNNRLYWSDYLDNTVEMSDLHGNGRTTLLQRNSHYHYRALSIFQQSLYITDRDLNSYGSRLLRLTLDGSRNVTVLWESNDTYFYDIHVFSPQTSLHSLNGCGINNGGCAGICIPLPGNRSTCLCPDGQILASNQTTCIKAFVSTSDPQPLETKGSQTMSLVCRLNLFMESITYVWNVPCIFQFGNECWFRPQPVKDDGKLVTCTVTSLYGQTVVGEMKLELNYPPQDAPTISTSSGYLTHQVGDTVNMTCSVHGGKPLVTSVSFSCGRHVGRSTNVSSVMKVNSILTIDSLTMEDDKTLCNCSAEWKNPDWYHLNTTQTLRVYDAESVDVLYKHVSIITGTTLSAVIVVILIIVIVFIVVRRRRQRRRLDHPYDIPNEHVYTPLRVPQLPTRGDQPRIMNEAIEDRHDSDYDDCGSSHYDLPDDGPMAMLSLPLDYLTPTSPLQVATCSRGLPLDYLTPTSPLQAATCSRGLPLDYLTPTSPLQAATCSRGLPLDYLTPTSPLQAATCSRGVPSDCLTPTSLLHQARSETTVAPVPCTWRKRTSGGSVNIPLVTRLTGWHLSALPRRHSY